MKKTHTEVDKSCELCDNVLKDKSELKRHLQEHSYKFISFQCSFCSFIAEDRWDKCENCGDIFTNLKDLKGHFLHAHEKENSRSVEHIKQNRNNSEIYDIRSYKFKDLFQQD